MINARFVGERITVIEKEAAENQQSLTLHQVSKYRVTCLTSNTYLIG